MSNLYRIPEQKHLAARLVTETFANTIFFTNSGTKSMELAIKMVRKYWHKKSTAQPTILTFEGAFHGRSTNTIAAAGSEKITKSFNPLIPRFKQLGWSDHDTLHTAIARSDIATVLIEPVQSKGGIRTLPDACLKGLRDLCNESSALLVLDKVQCKIGRTEQLFAHK